MTRFRLPLLVAALALAVAACSPASGGTDGTPPPAPATDVTVVADDMVFTETTVTVPAGRAFRMLFDNREGMPHNVAIYTDSSLAEPLFVGELISDRTIVYEIGALEPGTYFFRCDLHPEMTGTIVAEG